MLLQRLPEQLIAFGFRLRRLDSRWHFKVLFGTNFETVLRTPTANRCVEVKLYIYITDQPNSNWNLCKYNRARCRCFALCYIFGKIGSTVRFPVVYLDSPGPPSLVKPEMHFVCANAVVVVSSSLSVSGVVGVAWRWLFSWLGLGRDGSMEAGWSAEAGRTVVDLRSSLYCPEGGE